ncbi:ParA family protein [Proteiniphilum sp. UBA5346]|uniref:ParA family protein n=1 Tax=Proteiniphilum sp. UBA5346 TaxID=1947277 RepID=UPI00257D194E|nr:ParA family protein [Proteiniphilum sp. UBA5346]
MNNKPLFIAFSTQKGGVGKSAMTILAASILHFRMGYNVAVFDCDYPQLSISKLRERDVKSTLENERFKRLAYEQFTQLDKKAYPVIPCRAEEAIQTAGEFMKNSSVDYDMLFFDMPGTVNSSGILQTLSRMDYVFSPIVADRLVLESTLPFMNVLTDVLVKSGNTNIQGIYLFWNMVDRREKSELYAHYEQIIRELGLNLMQTSIPDSKRFRKELTAEAENRLIFRSTIFPADKRLMKSSRLDDFITELLQIIKK